MDGFYQVFVAFCTAPNFPHATFPELATFNPDAKRHHTFTFDFSSSHTTKPKVSTPRLFQTKNTHTSQLFLNTHTFPTSTIFQSNDFYTPHFSRWNIHNCIFLKPLSTLFSRLLHNFQEVSIPTIVPARGFNAHTFPNTLFYTLALTVCVETIWHPPTLESCQRCFNPCFSD